MTTTAGALAKELAAQYGRTEAQVLAFFDASPEAEIDDEDEAAARAEYDENHYLVTDPQWQALNTTARDIIREAYHASDRTDIDYHLTPTDTGHDAVILHNTERALAISDEWENGEHIGYSWTTWNMTRTEEGLLVHGEDCWDEGGSDSETEARDHVAAFLGRL